MRLFITAYIWSLSVVNVSEKPRVFCPTVRDGGRHFFFFVILVNIKRRLTKKYKKLHNE